MSATTNETTTKIVYFPGVCVSSDGKSYLFDFSVVRAPVGYKLDYTRIVYRPDDHAFGLFAEKLPGNRPQSWLDEVMGSCHPIPSFSFLVRPDGTAVRTALYDDDVPPPIIAGYVRVLVADGYVIDEEVAPYASTKILLGRADVEEHR